MKLLVYHVLLLCCMSSLFTGRRWVLYALALFLPLVQTLPQPYGFIVSAPNALLLGLLGLIMRVDKKENPSHPMPNLWIMVLWTVVLTAGALRTLLAPPEVAGISFNVSTIFRVCWYWTTPFVIYWLVYRLADSRQVARRIIALCMVSASGEAVLAVYERLQGVGRATAHLDEANRAGAYFAGVTVLFFAFTLIQKGRIRWLFAGAWVLAAAALFATLSRGGFVAMAVGSSVVFASVLGFSPLTSGFTKMKYIALGVLLVANIALILPERVQQRLLFTVNKTSSALKTQESPSSFRRAGAEEAPEIDGSSQDRLDLWKVGFILFKEKPYGHGAFTAIPLQTRFRGHGKAMHNIYLQVLVEHGVQGLACLLLLIGSVGWNLWRRFRLSRAQAEDSAIFLGLLGYWIALCAAHFFVNPFFMLHLNGQFWVMSACALRNGSGSRNAA